MPRRHELLRVTEDAWRAVRKGHPALDGLPDELVDELDHGRVFGGLVQRDDLRTVVALLEDLG